MANIRDRIADLKRKYPGTTVSWAPLKHGGGSFTVKEGGRLVAHIHLSERQMKETQNPRKRTRPNMTHAGAYSSNRKVRKAKKRGDYGAASARLRSRQDRLDAKSNPKRKRQTSIPKKVLEAHRRIWGGTIPPGALEALKREAARGGFRNPGSFPVVKKTTGWMSATAVKIVKRRGQPDQVLIRKPGSKKRRIS